MTSPRTRRRPAGRPLRPPIHLPPTGARRANQGGGPPGRLEHWPLNSRWGGWRRRPYSGGLSRSCGCWVDIGVLVAAGRGGDDDDLGLVDAHEEGLLGLGGDGGQVVELVLIRLDLVLERNDRGVESVLALLQGPRGGRSRELGLSGQLRDLRVAARLFFVQLHHHGIAGVLDLEDDPLALLIVAVAGGGGGPARADGDRVAVDGPDQRRHGGDHDHGRDDDCDDLLAEERQDGRYQRLPLL